MCKTYQSLLRLRDWQIQVKFATGKDDLADDLNGEATFTSEECTAQIVIRRRTDEEIEQTLIHELLHIRFHTVHRDEDSAFEFAIDSTAGAIFILAGKV